MTDDAKRTPPARSGSYEVTRFNAHKHGALSRVPVLPWEDRVEFDAQRADLLDEYPPETPTERALVEDLSVITWRLRRLQLGEGAVHAAAMARIIRASEEGPDETARVALLSVLPNFAGHETARALSASAEETATEFRDLEASEYSLHEALKILGDGLPDSYNRALSTVSDQIKSNWQRVQQSVNLAERALGCLPDLGSRLELFLNSMVVPQLRNRRIIIEHRGRIRDEAIGEAVASSIGELEKLARHEVHLRRRFEKTLTMLITLRERAGTFFEQIRFAKFIGPAATEERRRAGAIGRRRKLTSCSRPPGA